MSEASDQPSVEPVSILLVDDHPANLTALKTMLERPDYRFVSAESGKEALNEVLRQDFAVILMDVAMPGMDGIETSALIKQRKRSSHVPIVFVTAQMRDVETIAKSYAAGGVDYLMKPLVVDAVRAKVAAFVALFRARRRVELRSRQVQDELEAVAHSSTLVAEAVAGLPEASVTAVLKTIVLEAEAITGAEYAAVGVGTDPERLFDPWVYVGISSEVAQSIGRTPRPVGILGFVARKNVVFRARDIRRHDEFRGFPPNHPNMSSFLGVPLHFRGKSVGNLYLANKRGAEEFTDQDEHLVTMLAATAGVALETARLYHAEGMERAWLEMVIDQIPEGVILVDAQGHVVGQNRWMNALSPSETDELDPFGNPFGFDVWRPSGERLPASLRPNVRALLHNETTLNEELLVRRKDGEFLPVLVSATPLHTRMGEVAGAAMTLRDISQLRELENRRKEWTSIVAHDLRQPISTIALSAHALTQAVPMESARNVDRIVVSAQHLNEMIDDLLDVSTIEARRLTLRQGEVDLVALIRAVVDRSGAGVGQRCEIRAEAGAPDKVWADPGRIEQVLLNLLSNAVKYGEPNTPITISVSKSNDKARVVVTNAGPGIPAHELPHLFERFTRTASARGGKAGGLGLGLYICKGLIEAQGGRIWAESAPGTVAFHFTLPLVRPKSS